MTPRRRSTRLSPKRSLPVPAPCAPARTAAAVPSSNTVAGGVRKPKQRGSVNDDAMVKAIRMAFGDYAISVSTASSIDASLPSHTTSLTQPSAGSLAAESLPGSSGVAGPPSPSRMASRPSTSGRCAEG